MTTTTDDAKEASSTKLLRQKNKALHRELHRLRADVRYMTTALVARDAQLSMLTKRARMLEESLLALVGTGPITIAMGPMSTTSPTPTP